MLMIMVMIMSMVVVMTDMVVTWGVLLLRLSNPEKVSALRGKHPPAPPGTAGARPPSVVFTKSCSVSTVTHTHRHTHTHTHTRKHTHTQAHTHASTHTGRGRQ